MISSGGRKGGTKYGKWERGYKLFGIGWAMRIYCMTLGNYLIFCNNSKCSTLNSMKNN